MRINPRFSLALLALLLLGSATADASKIGFVQIDLAITNLEEGKQAFQRLNEWAEPREQYLNALLIEAAHIQQQIKDAAQAGASVVSKEQLQSLQQQLIDKQREHEDEQRKYNRDYQEKRDEFFRDVARRLNQLVNEYAEENGFDAVFIVKDQLVLYLSDDAQLTPEIVQAYNARYPVNSQ